MKYRKEIKRLEDSYKRYLKSNLFNFLLINFFVCREKDTNDKFLQDIEQEQERDMRQLEEKIRQEVI